MAELETRLLDLEITLEGCDLFPQYEKVFYLKQLTVSLASGRIVRDQAGSGGD